ncbi:unnamed protein product [Cuscuta europaea]|uniref:Reverse transcriptase domain-containing protein n=1 Tax=Cuscuta europaea TaxID=41803 RepID=A0A9P0ZIY7_CUSEU|nr:unnamed protein product [Cuscuta europaea]
MNSLWSANNITCNTHFFEMEVDCDHCASLVTIGHNMRVGSRPFKFFNMWLKHEVFTNILTNHWFQDLHGTPQFRLACKLKRLKGPLKELNYNAFGHISEKAKAANIEYKRVHALLLLSPLDEDIKNEVALAKKSALYLKKVEEDFFRKKAKANHLFQSDRGTKYFHSIVRKNVVKNSIMSIKLANGYPTTSLDQVGCEFVSFYTDLFGSSDPNVEIDPDIILSGKCIDSSKATEVIAPISDIEIKNVLFDIGDNKSPGPDGYTSAFFKHNWDIVGHDVILAVRGFFNSGKLLKQTNHTVVALIPKTSHDPSAADFRPISCTNVIYKVITKIIASRMIPCLPELIDPSQGAFIDGRLMLDNVFIAQELVKGYTRKRMSPRSMIKVDLRKAYDTISWDFLKSVLLTIGFPTRFVQWIMECVSTSSYSISINGILHGHIKGKRGLRQGDPMSPLLFVVCLEYFSRLLHMRNKVSSFKFHPKCGKLNISHVAYADDRMLFSRGDYPSIKVLIDALEQFGTVSGLRVNFDKSNIFLGGLVDHDLAHILDLIDFKEGTFPVRYVGIPLAPLKIAVAQYAPLLESITNFITAWNTKSLFYAGRVKLIKSVIQGVHSFWLQALPIPKTVLDRITSICRIFLWGCKFARVAWADICLPKEEGGLGIHDNRVWNSALLAKTLWNIHIKKDNLWVRWIHGVYLNGKGVWEFTPHKRDSQLIKKIARIRDQILSHFANIHDAVTFLNGCQINGKLSSAKVYNLLGMKVMFGIK